ncbi:MAG: hypothetical protein DHS80DRAFT_22240 [Piptocephalis tieghemiana]|nr:MAG: hypothetical protein DHS80DRAFT_22240 [Piptocephalis tieghemiana]
MDFVSFSSPPKAHSHEAMRIPELILGILEHLDKASLVSAIQVNSLWYCLGKPLLYRDLHLPLPSSAMVELHTTLEADASASRMVRSLVYGHNTTSPAPCKYIHPEDEDEEEPQEEMDIRPDIYFPLPLLPSLRSLKVQGGERGVKGLLVWMREQGPNIQGLRTLSIRISHRSSLALLVQILPSLSLSSLQSLDLSIDLANEDEENEEDERDETIVWGLDRILQSLSLLPRLNSLSLVLPGLPERPFPLPPCLHTFRLNLSTTMPCYVPLVEWMHRPGWRELSLDFTCQPILEPVEEDYYTLIQGSPLLHTLILPSSTHATPGAIRSFQSLGSLERLELAIVGDPVRRHPLLGSSVGFDGVYRHCGAREILRRYALPPCKLQSIQAALDRGHRFALSLVHVA